MVDRIEHNQFVDHPKELVYYSWDLKFIVGSNL